MGVKAFFIHLKQTDQRIAGHEVKINVGQRLQFIHCLCRSDQRQKEAQTGNFDRLCHNINAIEVLGDDLLADVIVERAVLFVDRVELGRQVGVVQNFNAAIERGIDVEQRFHRRHQKRARSTGRVKDRQLLQNVQQAATEISIEL